MREILFRGKRVDNGECITGYYAKQSNHACFANELKYTHFIYKDVFMDWNLGGLCETEVDPETIGQYTGLNDKNGKKIFEGDIIKAYFKPQNFKNPPYAIGNVIFENGTFKVSVRISKNSKEHKLFEKEGVTTYSIEHNFLDRHYVLEVIGNIHDNPELLEVAE